MSTWTARKEEELRQARQSAGWRWVAYVLTAVGLVVGFAGPGIIGSVSPDALEDDPKGVIQVAWIVAGLILVLAILLDIPAEKAAKKAKILKAEKQDATPAPFDVKA